jgi:hypothetical protein
MRMLLKDRAFMKKANAVGLLFILMLAASIVAESRNEGIYIVSDDGNLEGIEQRREDTAAEYNITLSYDLGEGEKTREITVTKSGTSKRNAEGTGPDESKIAGKEAEIDSIVYRIKNSDEKRIELPDELSDGTKLSWTKRRDLSGMTLYIPVLYIFVMIVMIRDRLTAPAREMRNTGKEIYKELPRFTNQLLLLMNAGVILSDAFERICKSYTLVPGKDLSVFESEMINISEMNRDHRMGTAGMLSELAKKTNVKELMRISTILKENEWRGSDVIENLARESEFMWEERKITAKEKGKMIDAKMAYPMGMLLVQLIIITMAPALIGM